MKDNGEEDWLIKLQIDSKALAFMKKLESEHDAVMNLRDELEDKISSLGREREELLKSKKITTPAP